MFSDSRSYDRVLPCFLNLPSCRIPEALLAPEHGRSRGLAAALTAFVAVGCGPAAMQLDLVHGVSNVSNFIA